MLVLIPVAPSPQAAEHVIYVIDQKDDATHVSMLGEGGNVHRREELAGVRVVPGQVQEKCHERNTNTLCLGFCHFCQDALIRLGPLLEHESSRASQDLVHALEIFGLLPEGALASTRVGLSVGLATCRSSPTFVPESTQF